MLVLCTKNRITLHITCISVFILPYLFPQATSSGSATSHATNTMSDSSQGQHNVQSWICRNPSHLSTFSNTQFRHSRIPNVKRDRQTDRQTLGHHDHLNISHFKIFLSIKPSICCLYYRHCLSVSWSHMSNQQQTDCPDMLT